MKKQSPFKKILYQASSVSKTVAPSPKPAKRENTFYQSRDNREDRATRQAKTVHHPPSLPSGR